MPIPTEIHQAPDAYHIAQPLIRQHHPHLLKARILWLVSSSKRTREGRVQLGVGKKLSPEARFLSSGAESVEDGYDYLVTLSAALWRKLDDQAKAALIDHELCHLVRKQTVNRRTGKVTESWARRGHDLEEFVEIVKRHGLWSADVRDLVLAGAQLALPTQDDEPEATEKEMFSVPNDQLERDFEEILGPRTDRSIQATDELEDVSTESADIAAEDLPDRSNGHERTSRRRRATTAPAA